MKEERQTSGRRRSSTGSGRFPKREAIELKEVMDYTLPEDRNKPVSVVMVRLELLVLG